MTDPTPGDREALIRIMRDVPTREPGRYVDLADIARAILAAGFRRAPEPVREASDGFALAKVAAQIRALDAATPDQPEPQQQGGVVPPHDIDPRYPHGWRPLGRAPAPSAPAGVTVTDAMATAAWAVWSSPSNVYVSGPNLMRLALAAALAAAGKPHA